MLWLSSYGVSTLAAFASLALAQSTNRWTQERDEYCAQGNLCLTSFKWCLYSRVATGNTSFLSGYCNGTELNNNDDFLLSPAGGVSSGPILLPSRTYDLTWINADPQYPVQVEWYFGPNEGVFNNTVPAWTTNVTGSSSLRFRPLSILYDLGEDNTQQNISYIGYSAGFAHRFVVSQPTRPAQANINSTDETNSFTMTNLLVETAITTIQRNNRSALDDQNQRWKRNVGIGVGVGVGVGVPLLLAIAFIIGRRTGRKHATKQVADGTPSNKESVDLSDGDRTTAT